MTECRGMGAPNAPDPNWEEKYRGPDRGGMIVGDEQLV